MTEDEQISAPERIWIEDEFGDSHEDQWAYGCWDVRNIGGYEVEYIRADLNRKSFNEGYLEGLKTAKEVTKGFDRSIITGARQDMITRRLDILIHAISEKVDNS